MNLSEKAWDDMTKISGIGESRQNWFRQSFGVRTFQDLSNLTVDQIEEKMKLDGLIISLNAIEIWLVQAGEFANQIDEASKTAQEFPAELSAGVSNAMPRENGWKPIASFVVEYQSRDASELLTEQRTVAHHMEKDNTLTWPGIEGKQLCEWIINQIPEEFLTSQKRHDLLHTQPPAESPEIKSTAVKITHLHIRQPANSASPNQSIDLGMQFQASVLREQPFSFEVGFELVGPTAEEVARNKIRWSAETRTFDPMSGTSPQLCEAGPNSFEKGRFKYELSFPEISLKRGAYRVWVLITPEQPSVALPDFLDIPNLLVV